MATNPSKISLNGRLIGQLYGASRSQTHLGSKNGMKSTSLHRSPSFPPRRFAPTHSFALTRQKPFQSLSRLHTSVVSKSKLPSLTTLPIPQLRHIDPIDLLRKWQEETTTPNDSSTFVLDINHSRELCVYFGEVASQVCCRNEEQEEDPGVWNILEEFLIATSRNHGLGLVSGWAMKTLAAGYGERVIQVWDRIVEDRLASEGLPIRPLRKADDDGKAIIGTERFRRAPLVEDIDASCLFTVVIWSYACRTDSSESFRDLLSRLLYQTFIRPLSSHLLFPFLNAMSVKVGEPNIERLLIATIPEETLHSRARRFVSQVEFAQIGCPDLEGWMYKTLNGLMNEIENDNSVDRWRNLFLTYFDACDSKSDVFWIEPSNLGRDLSHQKSRPVVITSDGILPGSGIYPPLLGKAFKVIGGKISTKDTLVRKILYFAAEMGFDHHGSFWYNGLQGVAALGNVKDFEDLLNQMRSRNLIPDDLCRALHVVTLLNSGKPNYHHALKELNKIMSQKQLRFGFVPSPDVSWYQKRGRTFQISIINTLLEHGLIESAIDFAFRIKDHPGLQKDSRIFDNILHYIIENSKTSSSSIHHHRARAIEIFNHMQEFKIPQSHITLIKALQLLGLEKLDEIVDLIERDGGKPSSDFWTHAMSLTTSSNDEAKLSKAEDIFNRVPKDNLSWPFISTMARGYLMACQEETSPSKRDEYFARAVQLKTIGSTTCGPISIVPHRVLILSTLSSRHPNRCDFTMELFQEMFHQQRSFFEQTQGDSNQKKKNKSRMDGMALMGYVLVGFQRGDRLDLAREVENMMEKMLAL